MNRLLSRIEEALAGLYDAAELDSVKKALCLELLGISSVTYYTKQELTPDKERDQKLTDALARLAHGEPLQYVMGYTPFEGLNFKVDSRVLIPRPETAELVEWIVRDCSGAGSVLDIGTGSGCIAVTLANKLPGCKVQGWDVSDSALDLACLNNRQNSTNVEFRKVDIFDVPEQEYGFDVIVSNPPYVLESEKSGMEARVVDYEPHLALFVPDNDPLLFYRAISEFGKKALAKGGKLFFEINPLKAEDIVRMLEDTGYHNVESRNDIFGKQRMIKAIL